MTSRGKRSVDSVYNQAKLAFQGLVLAGDKQPSVVREFWLEQDYANPFNPMTQIVFTIRFALALGS